MCVNYTKCLISEQPCTDHYKTLGTFEFRFNERNKLTLSPSAYLIQDGTNCVSLFTGIPINVTLPVDQTNKIILGTYFLKYFNSIYDFEKQSIKFSVKPEMQDSISFGYIDKTMSSAIFVIIGMLILIGIVAFVCLYMWCRSRKVTEQYEALGKVGSFYIPKASEINPQTYTAFKESQESGLSSRYALNDSN